MRKRILLLTDWYEPGYKAGGPIQSCRNFVLGMSDDFDIYVLTSDRDLGDEKPYPGITSGAWIKKNDQVQIYYAETKKLTAAVLRRLITEADPDYIYLNSMYSFHFTILPLWLKIWRQSDAKMVIAPRGMLQQGAMQFKPFKKKLFLGLLNKTGIVGRLIFHATDEQEKQDISSFFPSAKSIQVIPNFLKPENQPWKPTAKQPGTLRCAWISRLAPKKNILFLLDLLKEIPAAITFHLTLRGEIEDQQYWKKCLNAIDALPSNVTVRWEGPVNHGDIYEVLHGHHVFVLPTKGENFGHAIFEALSSGRPVLVSDRTPWRNLTEKKIGWDLPLDQPELFIQAMEQAAAFDQESYNDWSHCAWQYARDYTAKLNLKEAYLKLFN